MTLRTLHLLFILAAASVRCEPNFRWMLLRKGDLSEGTTFEILNDETMDTQNLRIMQAPCNCESLMCRCCAGFNFDQINYKREGCMVFGFDPMEFSLDMKIMMNDKVMWNNSISGKNPPPMCMPVPIPGFPAFRLDMCMKLYDIYFPGQNVHLCMDVDARMQGNSLMVLHFDCMRMGSDGWAMMKPGDKVEMVEEAGDEDTVYDIVYEQGNHTASSAAEAPKHKDPSYPSAAVHIPSGDPSAGGEK